MILSRLVHDVPFFSVMIYKVYAKNLEVVYCIPLSLQHICRGPKILGLFPCDVHEAPFPWKCDLSLTNEKMHMNSLFVGWNECLFFSLISWSIRDGKISREEMIDYFMKASSLLNCKMGFIHTFIETTYVKPTFCEHCTGFVSIIQSYRNRFKASFF